MNLNLPVLSESSLLCYLENLMWKWGYFIMFSPGLLWNCWYRKTLYKKRLCLKILPPRHVLNHFSLKLCKSIKRNLQCIVSWNCSFLFPGQFWYSSFKVCPTQIILNVFLCLSLHPVGTRRGDNTILFWGRIIWTKILKGPLRLFLGHHHHFWPLFWKD